MQPSSLVFVAIIAGWVVYLLPRWVAHRDALGQDRRADRDSAQLRVLARRAAAAHTVTSQRPRSSGPLLAAPGVTGGPAAHSQSVITTRSGPGLVREVVDRRARGRAAARRARVLLSLAIVALTSWGIVVLPGVPWWTAVPATTLFVVDVLALALAARRRASARRRRALQVAWTAAAAQRTLAAQRRPIVPVEVSLPAPRSDAVAEDAADAGPRGAAPSSPTPASAPENDGTWTPVPVPRPTYMLKPVVRRPEPPPLEATPDVAVAATTASSVPERQGPPEGSGQPPAGSPRPWELEHTWADDLDLFLARRRAVNG